MPVTKKILLSCERFFLTLGKETRKTESKSKVIKTNIKKCYIDIYCLLLIEVNVKKKK